MIVGKWHCGDQPDFLPTKHGFDHYYGIPYSNDMGRQIGREHYPPLPLMDDGEVIQEQPDQASITERYVERSVRFIRENKDQPFFLYLAHMYVHLPLYAPERFLKQSENGSYGAAVECIDWAASVLLDEIKELGLDENTLVVFTSDNGSRGRDEGGSNAPLNGGKGSTWEGGQRLPCIMRWPGKIPASSECNEMTLSMDFLPTFAELAGGEAPKDRIIDGKSITPLMAGEEEAVTQHDAFFYYFKDDIQAVRSGNWKLHIRRRDDEVAELYDLKSDIGETENVYDQHPNVVEDLLSKIQACREDIGDGAADMEGANCRPVGRVENPDTLTHYDPEHPYIIAMYDLNEAG
jgi:arylsulfatase A-like enzyme